MRWEAIVAFLKTFGPLLLQIATILASGLGGVIEYIVILRNRVKQAYENEYLANKQAKEMQAKKEAANVSAYLKIIDESWKVRYNQILNMIKLEMYADVLLLRKEDIDKPEVDNILFDKSLSAEYRAMKITERMRSHG